jgi:hypothetical protein
MRANRNIMLMAMLAGTIFPPAESQEQTERGVPDSSPLNLCIQGDNRPKSLEAR